jgi:hypothetical protein
MKSFIQTNIHDLANVCFVLHYRTQQISHQTVLVQAYNSLGTRIWVYRQSRAREVVAASYERTLRSCRSLSRLTRRNATLLRSREDGQNDLMILAVGYVISVALQKLYVLSPSS